MKVYFAMMQFLISKYRLLCVVFLLLALGWLTLLHIIPTFNDPEKEGFWKHRGKGENAGNQHFLFFSHHVFYQSLKEVVVNPLPHMPILGPSNSVANKNRMSEIWTNGVQLSDWVRKHCGKRRNCSLRAISSFPTMFSKAVCCWCVKMSIYGVKG